MSSDGDSSVDEKCKAKTNAYCCTTIINNGQNNLKMSLSYFKTAKRKSLYRNTICNDLVNLTDTLTN